MFARFCMYLHISGVTVATFCHILPHVYFRLLLFFCNYVPVCSGMFRYVALIYLLVFFEVYCNGLQWIVIYCNKNANFFSSGWF